MRHGGRAVPDGDYLTPGEALDAGATRMTLRNRGRPAGFSAVAGPFMAAAMRRANRKDLAALRTHLETRG